MSFGTFVGTERERVNADIMTLLRSVRGPIVSGSKSFVKLEAISRYLFVKSKRELKAKRRALRITNNQAPKGQDDTRGHVTLAVSAGFVIRKVI